MTEKERNAKIKYLESYKWLNAEIEDDEERLARLDARLYSPGAVSISDMPKGGQPVTMDSLVAQKMELQERINEKCGRRKAILDSIERMTNARDRLILKYRFVDNLTHDKIAERLNYSNMQVRRYYESALEHYQKWNRNEH